MIVALQFCEGDMEATMSLARLIADLETRFRDDTKLSLVYQPGTSLTPLVSRTLYHCSLKFEVELVESPLGAAGHPEGCTALWAGTCRHYFNEHESGRSKHTSILTLDGGDGVPLHRDWIAVVQAEHEITLGRGKLITGTPYFLGTCPLHVNPNAVFELDVFGKTSLLTDVPKYDGTLLTHFDVYHRAAMLDHAELSSIVHTDWRGGGHAATREILAERSRESVWLHGYKDPGLHWIAREHLASNPAPPQIKHYNLPTLRTHEAVRRSYEASCR
jgi:hypothetical protein